MAGKIICAFTCVLCAAPFLFLSYLGKMRKEPLAFWAGDEKRLTLLITDIQSYNQEMAKHYKDYGIGFLLSGGLFLCYPILGLSAILYDITFCLFFLWKKYKHALSKYSNSLP